MRSTPEAPVDPPAHPWAALGVAVVAVVALGVVLARLPAVQAPPAEAAVEQTMVAVSPGGTVDITTLSADVQELYHAARDDMAAFSEVPCHCGCEAMLDHRHLGDCFVRPDGGWERHAVGCGICQAEARDVVAARNAGTPIDTIVADIDAAYGAITGS